MKLVIFRVDSSAQIGSGHLMRCLTLANQIKKSARIIFISRKLIGNLNYLIAENNFEVIELPSVVESGNLSGYEKWLTVKQNRDAQEVKSILKGLKPDVLVVDHYAIDDTWEKIIRPYVNRIMVIDDLANRKHDCDILLDQNYGVCKERIYSKLVSSGCRLLIGPKYVLLRDEFYQMNEKNRSRDGTVKNIFVFFGGSDLTNETIKSLKAIALLDMEDLTVNVVVGGSNRNKEDIENYCKKHHNIKFFYQINNIAELMNEADLAIGGGGSTTWERCFLGLPTIVVAVADNQRDGCKLCGDKGLLYYVGMWDKVTISSLSKSIRYMIKNKKHYKHIIEAMKKEFPGNRDMNLSSIIMQNEV